MYGAKGQFNLPSRPCNRVSVIHDGYGLHKDCSDEVAETEVANDDVDGVVHQGLLLTDGDDDDHVQDDASQGQGHLHEDQPSSEG